MGKYDKVSHTDIFYKLGIFPNVKYLFHVTSYLIKRKLKTLGLSIIIINIIAHTQKVVLSTKKN